MKDQGIDRGLVQKFDTSSPEAKNKWGWRKMFWDYLKKLHVPFADVCCEDAAEESQTYPVRFNYTLQRLEYFDGSNWVDITVITETTTTTSTTTTTTAGG